MILEFGTGNGAGVRGFQQIQAAEKGAFSAAAGTNDRDYFAFVNSFRNPFQDFQLSKGFVRLFTWMMGRASAQILFSAFILFHPPFSISHNPAEYCGHQQIDDAGNDNGFHLPEGSGGYGFV